MSNPPLTDRLNAGAKLREGLVLLGISLLAAFFRLYRLNELPPGFQFDQAYYVFDSLRLLQGQFFLFFAAPGGTEPLFPYLSMVGVALFGVSPMALKITSAIIGILTVPLVYALAKTVFSSARIGLLAAFFTAISVWHMFYGRYGERITLLVLLAAPMFMFFWRALEMRFIRDYVLAAVFLSLGLYTNLAARVLPVILVVITAYCMWTDRKHARDYIKGLAVMGAVTLVLFSPLEVYFFFHPGDFFLHTAQVSILDPHASQGGDIAAALVHNATRLAEMFFVRGDEGIIRNVPNRPIFDPFVAILFVAGTAMLLSGLLARSSTERRRSWFILAWILVGMAVALVSDDAPNFSRLSPIIPAVMILPAWGASAIWDRLLSPESRRVAAAAFGIIVIVATGLAYSDYFRVFASDPGLFYAFDVHQVDASTWLNENAKRAQIFVAPLVRDAATVSLLTRQTPLKSFDSRDTIVLPSRLSQRDAVFAFPVEQEQKAQTMLLRLGKLGMREDVKDSAGGTTLINVLVPASRLPDSSDPLAALSEGGDFLRVGKALDAEWAGQIRLLGTTLTPEGPGGRNLAVTLFFSVSSKIEKDYTFSVKVRDSSGRTWGQEDKWTGDNSYQTSIWSPGDLVVERFYPGLEACAPEGDYQVSVEAYDPNDMRVLSLVGGSTTALLGRFTAGASQGNRMEDLEPEHRQDLPIGPGMRLFGYSDGDGNIERGAKQSIALFWNGSANGSTVPIQVTVKDSIGREHLISQGSLTLPAEGRGICTLLDVELPVDTAPGPAGLYINNSKTLSLNVAR